MKRLIYFLILVIILFGLYSRFLGTKGLEVYEYNITNESLNGLTIVHFSDLLFGGTTDINSLTEVKNKINEYQPDVVIFTGNLIKDNALLEENQRQELINELKNINSSEKKYAILGNEDEIDRYSNIMNEAGFKILNNESDLLFKKDNLPIMFYGIKDFDKIKEIDEEVKYKIALIHESDYADKIIDKNFNLILAGHSLGGLIKIPFVGSILKQDNASKYVAGYYHLSDTTSLYVSPGIGTDKIPLRAFNKPSINVYRLNKPL